MNVQRLAYAICISLMACSIPVTACAAPDLERAESLIRAGQAQAAYDLLEPHEFDEAGNLKYDYLLGLAALEAGRPEKASLVFERVLAVEPRYLGVRVDLGRSYFLLGDIARASQEFQAVLAQSPPPDLQAIAERHLREIEEAKRPRRTTLTAYVEIGAGRDTNVNSATSVNPINLPGANNQPFFLDPDSLSQADYYATAAAGAELGYRLDPRWSLYLGADARYRGYADVDSANYGMLDGRTGAVLNLGRHLLRAGVLGGKYWLGDVDYRDSYGGNAEWRYQATANDQLSLNGQYVLYRYTQSALESGDFNQGLLSAGWLRVLTSGRTLFSVNLNGGHEDDVGGRQDGPAWLGGVRLFGQTALTDRIGLFATVGGQYTAYQTFNDTFLTDREDTLCDATIGLNWQFADRWTLRPQAQFTRNFSNIDLYDFKRADLSVNLRRDFSWP